MRFVAQLIWSGLWEEADFIIHPVTYVVWPRWESTMGKDNLNPQILSILIWRRDKKTWCLCFQQQGNFFYIQHVYPFFHFSYSVRPVSLSCYTIHWFVGGWGPRFVVTGFVDVHYHGGWLHTTLRLWLSLWWILW